MARARASTERRALQRRERRTEVARRRDDGVETGGGSRTNARAHDVVPRVRARAGAEAPQLGLR